MRHALTKGLTKGVSVALLAGCVPPSPEPTPAPTPTSTPMPAPTPSPTSQPVVQMVDDWQGAPLTQGDWFYTAEPDETIASFGTSRATADTKLIVVCRIRQRHVAIGYVGQGPQQGEMMIRTETATRTLPAIAATGRAPLILAELSVFDPLLDAMAFSKGRFAVDASGQPTLIAPAYPEITRVIEDCRGKQPCSIYPAALARRHSLWRRPAIVTVKKNNSSLVLCAATIHKGIKASGYRGLRQPEKRRRVLA